MAAGGAWKASTKMVIASPIDKVWEVSSDFNGIYRWFPAEVQATSRISEGEPQVVGCVRSISTPVATADERLVELNHEEHVVRYKIEENSLGLEGLCATFKLSPLGDATLVEWSCEKPAADGRTEEEFAEQMIPRYNGMLKGLEALVLA